MNTSIVILGMIFLYINENSILYINPNIIDILHSRLFIFKNISTFGPMMRCLSNILLAASITNDTATIITVRILFTSVINEIVFSSEKVIKIIAKRIIIKATAIRLRNVTII